MSGLEALAKNIIEHSCSVQRGEKVYIFAEGLEAKPLVLELVKQLYGCGAEPYVEVIDTDIQKEFLRGSNAEQVDMLGEFRLAMLKKMHCLIAISALENPYVYAGIPLEKMAAYNKSVMQKCIFEYAVMNTRWISLKYPTNAMAVMSGKNREDFESFYYAVCGADYKEMSRRMDRLKEYFERTDRVRIVARDTDLSFSIKGIAVQKSDGKNGLPDGEVFTAPVRDSANGQIRFNVPVYFRGTLFEDIFLELKNGRIVRAEANDSAKLNAIFDQDTGGRFLGEFAMGVNNRIKTPMKDILFDEKIGGSIHLAVGNSYLTTDNGNHSRIHMDIVQLQTPEFGGGEVWFDGTLIRKDGRFVPDDLKGLDEVL